jgi:hypothetical protein
MQLSESDRTSLSFGTPRANETLRERALLSSDRYALENANPDS